MQSPVLERLVGGVVLVGLLLLLALLIGPREGHRMPDQEALAIPGARDAIEPAKSAAAAIVQDNSPQVIQVAPRDPVPLSEETLRVAEWGVQVGSFTERGNAERLSEQYREQGFGVKVVTSPGEDGQLYRVRVGPYASRDSARSARAQLALQGRSTFVTDWNSDQP
ncbi:SPOR domain-containing protein [Candidatus Foliamicus sp.]